LVRIFTVFLFLLPISSSGAPTPAPKPPKAAKGNDGGANTNSKSDGSNKATKNKDVPKKEFAKAPAVPVPFPDYTTPAPVEQSGLPPTSIYNNGAVDQIRLEKWLDFYPFVSGFALTKKDAEVLMAVEAAGDFDVDDGIAFGTTVGSATSRWMRHMCSYSPVERAQWQ
jgi:hypothetical protein